MILGICTVISFLLYIFSTAYDAEKFYYLPFRFFEIGLGGIVTLYIKEWKNIIKSLWVIIICLLAWICLVNMDIDTKSFKLLTTCWLSIVALLLCTIFNIYPWLNKSKIYITIGYVGKISYSIFIWHQVIFALYRYTINGDLHTIDYIILLILVAIVSWLSYKLVENPLNKIDVKKTKIIYIFLAILFIISTSFGFYLYKIGGVVRDVPELNIKKGEFHTHMHAEYNDRVYKMDRDYANNGKIKVFVTGDSFTRDWINILLESKYKDSLDITYAYSVSNRYVNRIKEADVVFVRASEKIDDLPSYLKENMRPGVKIWGIGTKAFGISNGNIYNHRHNANYHNMKVTVPEDVRKDYITEKMYWRNNYIDIMGVLLDNSWKMPAFDINGKFLSQDCRHLTKAGAQYFAKTLNLDRYFKNINRK